MVDCWVIRWMSHDLSLDKPTLVQIMACCRQATSNYPNQCWPKCMISHGVLRLLSVYVAATLLSNEKTPLRSPLIMMTSSNGNIFRVTGHFCGEFTGPGEFPAQRPVTRSFHVFFDLRLNKSLSKESWGWWFETPSHPLWRHRNVWDNHQCGNVIFVMKSHPDNTITYDMIF